MSASLILRAAEAVRGSHPHMQVVLLQMAASADKKAVCSLTQASLAEACCLSIDSVQRALKGLEEVGLIRRQFQHKRDGRRRADKTVIMPDNTAHSGIVTASQHRSQRYGQHRAERLGQHRSQRQPVKSNIYTPDAASDFPSQEGDRQTAANDRQPLVVIHGGRVA